ncbi:MAG TPA: alpha/beta hydrolase [Mucilaginibacter sp.]|jgi:pimeloyl-ACP methyl ester carboxylesterase
MGFIQIQELGTAYFHEYGEGQKPLLAFHGYGMTGKQFEVLKQSVLKKYHVYGFDHFFHGNSQLHNWTEAEILAGMPKTLVRQYVEQWFKQYGRQRFSVMGYSIGANLALILVEEYPDLIDDVILMAPDGLSVYKGFDILRNTGWGKYLFRRVTKSKWLAPSILKTLRRIRFIDDSLFQIAYSEMDTEQKRLDVYYTLNLIRLLVPDAMKTAHLINEYNVSCVLIFGKHDELFTKKAAMPFINLLKTPQVHEVLMGHWLVTPALDEYLVSLAS